MATKTDIEVREAVTTRQRISTGLIALSLSLFSLSLGVAIFSSNAAVLFGSSSFSAASDPTSATAITLTWTAPGDDGSTGTATSYDLRLSTSPITDLNFGSAAQLAGEPNPQVAGSTETFTATNLTPSTTYYFALKTADEVNNVSALSNIASKTTDALAQACVPVYSCTAWSACTTGTQTRTCTVTNGCPAGLDQPVGSQICTVPVTAPTDTPPTDTPPPTETPEGGEPAAHVSRHIIAVGTGPGTRPLVRVVTPSTGRVTKEFAPFTSTERNGMNVAVGEFTGDGLPDIVVGTGAGTAAKVKVFTDGGTKFAEFNPYSTQGATGVSVATGDVNGDGRDEIITVPARGTSQVRIFSYNTTTKKFESYAQGLAYSRTLLNGWSVASADLDLDGRAEILVAPRTQGRTVTVWQVTTSKTMKKILTFSPYSLTARSGITLATGDVNGDGRPDILTALGSGYWTDVKAFDNRGRIISHFEPFARSYLGGASLAGLDVNSDGRDEVLVVPSQPAYPYLRIFRYSGLTGKFSQQKRYLVYPSRLQFGLRVGSI